MQEQMAHLPDWWFRGRRPTNDNVYFENMCRIIFQTGLNWRVVEKKWPTICRAFSGFDLEKVAAFNDSDLQRLLNDKGVIRNQYKIFAIIENAKMFLQIIRQDGSFQAFIDNLDKSGNYAKVVKVLSDTFCRIGPTTAALFLYSVGENINLTRMY
jgi:DNA-3-methyladenine glycosylase I